MEMSPVQPTQPVQAPTAAPQPAPAPVVPQTPPMQTPPPIPQPAMPQMPSAPSGGSSSSMGPIVGAIVLVILVAAAGGAYWWWSGQTEVIDPLAPTAESAQLRESALTSIETELNAEVPDSFNTELGQLEAAF